MTSYPSSLACRQNFVGPVYLFGEKKWIFGLQYQLQICPQPFAKIPSDWVQSIACNCLQMLQ